MFYMVFLLLQVLAFEQEGFLCGSDQMKFRFQIKGLLYMVCMFRLVDFAVGNNTTALISRD